MKKIKLSFKNMKEVLSRDELRLIVGGFGSGCGIVVCECEDGSGTMIACDVYDCSECQKFCDNFCSK